ncbi:uncharacterized protein LOC123439823 [Hordeum vulgare subsp. vulgare]|uniref:uncharacterized protein LOC123439823 n=1 Tax=Hordeum vulgare subsp. vulgare TaxID=112509 RepID=UPI001D1A47E7|nr:uncharacterized protein LOC123439823 [Hordeum vulgare subsp. vulgare]
MGWRLPAMAIGHAPAIRRPPWRLRALPRTPPETLVHTSPRPRLPSPFPLEPESLSPRSSSISWHRRPSSDQHVEEDSHRLLLPSRASSRAGPPHTHAIEDVSIAYIAVVRRRSPLLCAIPGLSDLAIELLMMEPRRWHIPPTTTTTPTVPTTTWRLLSSLGGS